MIEFIIRNNLKVNNVCTKIPVNIDTRIDSSGDFVVSCNEVDVLYISCRNGKVFRYDLHGCAMPNCIHITDNMITIGDTP